jgi:MYXO-CTERM domain-containing protein
MSRRSLQRLGVGLALLGILLTWGAPSRAAPPPMSRDDIICRAASAVGFSYHWGGACWCASGCSPNWSCSPGSCSGNCGNCTHSGTYGADCSGLAAHTWQVPNAIAVTHCDHGPYGASAFSVNGTYWDVISRSALQHGDTLACSHHVVIFQQGDPWGSLRTYEARGCSYGIVHNWRTCTSDYHAARRHNLISACECTAGESQTADCGNCGSHSRTCQSNCHWGSWSGCAGQGECAAGSTDSVACCDCGHRTRTCSSHCSWGAFGECGGPDPTGPAVACDTGEPGPCADGTVRCVKGCLGCASNYSPVAEICDDFDNDCSGVVDDGDPTVMGDPPPAFAARLFDLSVPSYLDPGERSTAWAGFVNVGTHGWPRGQVLLVASLAQDNQGSQLYDETSWPAWDVAARLDRDVQPGESGYLTWMVRAPLERGEAVEQFRLAAPDGTPMQCPATTVALDVHVGGEPAPTAAEPAAAPSEGCSCRLGGGSRTSDGLGAIGLLALGAILRRRRRAGA